MEIGTYSPIFAQGSQIQPVAPAFPSDISSCTKGSKQYETTLLIRKCTKVMNWCKIHGHPLRGNKTDGGIYPRLHAKRQNASMVRSANPATTLSDLGLPSSHLGKRAPSAQWWTGCY